MPMVTQAGAWTPQTRTSSPRTGKALLPRIRPSWKPLESSSLQSLVKPLQCWSNYRKCRHSLSVDLQRYSWFYPGIVAGANLSGDLKDPSYSIPKVDIWHILDTCFISSFQGTLLAIAGTYVTYMYFGLQVHLASSIFTYLIIFFQTGFVFANQASGVKEEYLFFNNKSDLNSQCDPTNKTGGDCPPFALPKWLDCSDAANKKRDLYKALFEVRLAQVYK